MDRITSIAVPSVKETAAVPTAGLMKPSMFYRSGIWRLGMALSRFSPRGCEHLAKFVAAAYWSLCPGRREVVINNLLPVFRGDAEKANRCAQTLFSEFCTKL